MLGSPHDGGIHGEFCSVPCSVCQGTAKSKLKDQKLPVLTAEFIGMTVFNEAIYYLYPLGDCHLPGTGNLFQHYHLIILTVMWLSSHQHRLQPHRQCCTEHVLHKGKGSIPSKPKCVASQPLTTLISLGTLPRNGQGASAGHHSLIRADD